MTGAISENNQNGVSLARSAISMSGLGNFERLWQYTGYRSIFFPSLKVRISHVIV